jgi:hypothetical protein
MNDNVCSGLEPFRKPRRKATQTPGSSRPSTLISAHGNELKPKEDADQILVFPQSSTQAQISKSNLKNVLSDDHSDVVHRFEELTSTQKALDRRISSVEDKVLALSNTVSRLNQT